MVEEGFRLPGSSYEDLANIIIAYGTRDEASNPGDVGKLDIVHQSSASRNNAFLTWIGVLAGDREKYVTEEGRALALALARKDRAAIKRKWREFVSRDEFMQNVLSAVKLREGIFHSTLQAYIAHYAGQPRNKPVMTGATAVIGILKAAALLSEEAGMLVANYDRPDESPGEPSSDDGRPRTAGGDTPREQSAGEAEETVGISASTTGGGGSSVGVTVHVHVSCGPEEIESLAPSIKRLLRELREIEDG